MRANRIKGCCFRVTAFFYMERRTVGRKCANNSRVKGFVLTFKFVVLFSNSFLMLFKVHLNLREVLYIHQIKHHTKGVLDNE